MAQMIAPGKLRVPRAAVKPESRRMTSDGMGGKMDSRAMAKATPIPPMVSISMIGQSVMVRIQAGFGGGADGCGVGCKNSGGCHGKTHEGMSQGFPRIRSMTQEDVHFVDKSAERRWSPADSAVSVPTLSKPGLLVMDVDSTLIDEEGYRRVGRGGWLR